LVSNQSRFPSWLLSLSATQAGALLVFMNFAGAMPLLQVDWGLSNAQAGAIQSAGQAGYVIAVLLISSLTDYIESRWLIVGGALWAGVGNLIFAAFAYDTTSAIIIRAIVGIGIAGIYMPGMKLISQKTTPNQRGRAVGFFVASFTLGSAASIALSGNLAAIWGWRVAFGLTSIGPILGAWASWHFLPKSNNRGKLIQQPGKLKEQFKNRQAVAIILIYICHAWEVLGLRSWISAYLTSVKINAGVNLADATRSGATVAGLATLLAAFATAFAGAISDRASRIKIILLIMAVTFFFIMSLGFSIDFPWGLVILISLVAVFLTNADSAVITAKLTEVVPGDTLGRTLAIYSFLGFTAGSISPLVFGAALDYANAIDVHSFGAPWSWAFATLALGSVLGFLFALGFLRKSNPVKNVV
jgi:MFS family permease